MTSRPGSFCCCTHVSPELCGLAISVVFGPVPGRGMVPLTPKRPPHVSHMRRRRRNRRHVAEKACIFRFVSVPHCPPPGQVQCSPQIRDLFFAVVFSVSAVTAEPNPCVSIFDLIRTLLSPCPSSKNSVFTQCFNIPAKIFLIVEILLIRMELERLFR
jgi:hypothetical protein